MARYLQSALLALATTLVVLGFWIGDPVTAWALVAVLVLFAIELALTQRWHLRLKVRWLRLRIVLLDHAIAESREEVNHFESMNEWSMASSEGDFLQRMQEERAQLVLCVIKTDAVLYPFGRHHGQA